MRLVTWNCNGAYRKKAALIAAYKPDLAVIQECESLEKLKFGNDTPHPSASLWFGNNPNRGLGIFSYTGLHFEPHSVYDDSIKYCVPLKVSGHRNFNLIAIWAMAHKDPSLSYIGQVFQALAVYQSFIEGADTLLIGDFNGNKIWDRPRRVSNHSRVVADLKKAGIVSLYHTYFKEDQGLETQPTFYLYRNQEKSYHLDYCFAPNHWLPKLKFVSVGAYADWSHLSDHSPVFVEFDS